MNDFSLRGVGIARARSANPRKRGYERRPLQDEGNPMRIIIATALLAATASANAAWIAFETYTPERIEFWIYNGHELVDGMPTWTQSIGSGDYTVESLGAGEFLLRACPQTPGFRRESESAARRGFVWMS